MPTSEFHTANSDTPTASALVFVGMDNNPSLELAAAPAQRAALHVFTSRSSGGHGRNSIDVLNAFIELLVRRLRRRDYDLARRHLDYDLESGGQAHRRAAHLLAAAAAAAADNGPRRRGGGAAAPVQEEPSEFAKMLQLGFMVQAYATFLPACVTAYPQLKDASDHVKLTIFGGLAFITVGLFVGILSRSGARRRLAMRLVSFSAIAALTFTVASQLSSRIYIALTAVVGVAVNFIVMMLPF